MGFQNTQTKNYIRQNDHFADLCNYFLFDGQDVIRPEELEERDVTELALPQWIEGAATLERIRDGK